MIVEDPEGFKSWMTKILEPMCDADPEALAKYVYALVKKDKPLNELMDTMNAQLEVFLQKETKPFVDLLFRKLENQGQNNNVTVQVKIKEEPMHDNVKNSASTSSSAPVMLPVSTSAISTTQLSINTAVVAPLEITKEEKKEPVPPRPMPPQSSTAQDRELRLSNMQIIKDQISAVSSGQRNGTLGAALLSAANRRSSVSERRSSRKSDSEREDRGGSSGRSRSLRRRGSSSPIRRPERSRSRSWERNVPRRSRSRDRERDKSRAWRNKSPPSRRYERERRRSYSKSPPPVRRSRTRSRSRSPIIRTRTTVRYRNRSPPLRSRSRSRSLSPADRRSRSPLSGGATPTQDSNHGDTDMRLSTTSQSIQSVVNMKDGLTTKRRCQDYDEKGYCMKGELCPYDHGSDPVVLEDVTLPQVLSFPTSNNQSIPPPPPPLDAAQVLPLTTAPPVLPAVRMPSIQAIHHRPQGMIRPTHGVPGVNTTEYNPDAPSIEPRMWGRQYFSRPTVGRSMLRGARGLQRGLPAMRGGSLQYMTPPPVVQRELISVPVHEVDYNQANQLKRPLPGDFSEENCIPLKQQQFDFSRLGPRRQPLHKPIMTGGNCTLQLKKVPIELNNIAHLNNHFAKFGKIVNIQVSFEGDPEAALITFSNHGEANLAYRSTEAVLNNRFIKVRWHFSEKDGKQENVPPVRVPAKERLGAPVVAQQSQNITLTNTPREIEKVVLSGSSLTKTVYIPTVLNKSEAQIVENNKPTLGPTLNQTLKKRQEIEVAKEIIKKKREEKQKEALRMSQQIMKKNQDLIEKLLGEQKLLIERIEKGNLVPEARNETLDAIQALQENIDLIRKEIEQMVDKRKSMNIVKALKASPQLVKQKRDETQRQILDAELDIFNRQQEGKDTADLQKRVLELKTKAQSLGLLTGNIQSRGRGRPFRGRGRGIFVHSSVDHRPTRVLVSGFETDDKAEVLAHFAKYGEIIDYVWDETTPALELNFKTRKEAEAAMKSGRNFQDRLLSVTWYSTGQGLSMRNNMMRPMLVMTNEGVGNLLDDQEEEEDELGLNLGESEDFLLQDEEEEEDEVRSWRR